MENSQTSPALSTLSVLALASTSLTSPVNWYCFGPAAIDTPAIKASTATKATTVVTNRVRIVHLSLAGGVAGPRMELGPARHCFAASSFFVAPSFDTR